MSGQSQAKTVAAPGETVQRLNFSRIASAVVAGAAAGAAIEVAPLVVGDPWQSFMLIAGIGLFVWLLVGAIMALPLFEMMYRRGCQRWWHAALFGMVLGLVIALAFIRETSGLALRFKGIIGVGSAVTALIIWWIAYRPRACLTPPPAAPRPTGCGTSPTSAARPAA